MWANRVMGWCLSMAFAAAGCALAEAPRAVAVRIVDHAGLTAEIAAHRGKVVVLDCWSTSCPPCVREFPRLVALAEAFPGDVVCISLSFDYEGIGTPEEVVPKVRTFLEAVGAGRVVNLVGSDDSDLLATKLDLVGVPAVFVYGREGRLLERFDDDGAKRTLGRPFTYDDVEKTVRAGLGDGAPRQ
jgi:thiol-disulfide isomerase/thioredoxin